MKKLLVIALTLLVWSVPGLAWAGTIPNPVSSEATDDLGEEEVPPQPQASVQPRCDQWSFDHRQYMAMAELDLAIVDRWATFRLITRAKQSVKATSVVLTKYDVELGPGEFRNDIAVFALEMPYLADDAGVQYRWVKPVIKLVQPGKNLVLADWQWNRVQTLFWTSSCNRSYANIP